jgi:hypothetical protein
MALLHNASIQQLRRLLEFFPAPKLKEEWPGTKGQKKSDVCEIIAGTRDYNRMSAFLRQNFAHCRQHVHILSRNNKEADPLAALPASDPIGDAVGAVSFHLASVPYTVYLLDPIEKTSIDVLWPIKIQQADEITIVRTFVLERDPSNYTGRPLLKAIREFDEKKLAVDLANLGLPGKDLNKGVKHLWRSEEIDAPRVRFKKEQSTNTVDMDEGKGLRETDPDAFKDIMGRPLLNTNFRSEPDPEDPEKVQKLFQVNATFGRIGFTSYNDDPGDTDAVIESILANNQ